MAISGENKQNAAPESPSSSDCWFGISLYIACAPAGGTIAARRLDFRNKIEARLRDLFPVWRHRAAGGTIAARRPDFRNKIEAGQRDLFPAGRGAEREVSGSYKGIVPRRRPALFFSARYAII